MRNTPEIRTRLAEYQRENGLNETQMAATIGCSRASLMNIKNGNSYSINDTIAANIARLIGVEELVFEESQKNWHVVGVTVEGQLMLPFLRPGTEYMALQEDPNEIADGEIVALECWLENEMCQRYSSVRAGHLWRAGSAYRLECGGEEMILPAASIIWCARILRPIAHFTIPADVD